MFVFCQSELAFIHVLFVVVNCTWFAFGFYFHEFSAVLRVWPIGQEPGSQPQGAKFDSIYSSVFSLIPLLFFIFFLSPLSTLPSSLLPGLCTGATQRGGQPPLGSAAGSLGLTPPSPPLPWCCWGGGTPQLQKNWKKWEMLKNVKKKKVPKPC